MEFIIFLWGINKAIIRISYFYFHNKFFCSKCLIIHCDVTFDLNFKLIIKLIKLTLLNEFININ